VANKRESWKTVASRLRADHDRLALLLAWQDRGSFYLHPSFVSVVLYRVSRRFFENGHTFVARLVGHFNELLTGADISPASDVGEGFVILTPPGAAIYGKAGRNLTLMPCAGIGGEVGRREDIGGGPGHPVVGDDVILEPHSGILGPVRVGNRVRVGAAVMVSRDVPDDTYVEGPAPRFLRQRSSE
jgi:serine O-acetyltransferase